MVEVAMVRRMTRRAFLLAPVIVAAVWAFSDARGALSAAVGLAMTLGNLWLSARLIGGVAEKTPALLLPVALATFALGLLLLTGVALGLRAADLVDFPITGFTLIGTHLGLVLWEAAGAYNHADATAVDVRS
jgi:hypothetical protein